MLVYVGEVIGFKVGLVWIEGNSGGWSGYVILEWWVIFWESDIIVRIICVVSFVLILVVKLYLVLEGVD